MCKPSALGAFDGQSLNPQRLLEWDEPAPVWGEGPPGPRVPQEEALPPSFQGTMATGTGRGWEGRGKGRGGEQQTGLSVWVKRGEVK